jgi:hypothetical protein
MVCLRNICVNTLHKGDSIFTNNNNSNNDDDDDDKPKHSETRRGIQQIVNGTFISDKWLQIHRSGQLSVKRLHKYKRIFNFLIQITLKAS